jgi:leucyl-tRNA synthetase
MCVSYFYLSSKANADKLKREIETFGCPPKFPVEENKDENPKQKGKIEAKTGGTKYVWKILSQSGIDEAEIPKFVDARYWIQYFPEYAMVSRTMIH